MGDKTIVGLYYNPAKNPAAEEPPARRTWKKGEWLLGFDEFSDAPYMVVKGTVDLVYRPDDPHPPMLTEFAADPDPRKCPVVCARSYFFREPSCYGLIARTECLTLRIGSKLLHKMYSDCTMPSFVKQMVHRSDISGLLVPQMAVHLEMPGAETLSPQQFNAICDALDNQAFTEKYCYQAMELFRELVDLRNATVDPRDRSIVTSPPHAASR